MPAYSESVTTEEPQFSFGGTYDDPGSMYSSYSMCSESSLTPEKASEDSDDDAIPAKEIQMRSCVIAEEMVLQEMRSCVKVKEIVLQQDSHTEVMQMRSCVKVKEMVLQEMVLQELAYAEAIPAIEVLHPLTIVAAEEMEIISDKRIMFKGLRKKISDEDLLSQSITESAIRISALGPDPEEQKLKWTKIFQLQQADGYWELTVELGKLINVNVDVFVNVFLKDKGIHSLGAKVNAGIQRMVATLLVLQLMREEKLEEGKLLQSLFHLMEPTGSRSERWHQVKKAVDWVRWADRQYPYACSRLELGSSWELSIRQLLGLITEPPEAERYVLPLCEGVTWEEEEGSNATTTKN